jgi:NADPH:quinone reductase-like Zn-dependent oxidoreductase
MKVIEVAGGFGLEHLRLAARPIVEPGPRQVRVRVTAVSLNYRDLLLVRGLYNPRQPLPVIPCSDAAGVVEAVGAEVTRFAFGDRVTGCFFPDWIEGALTPEKHATAPGGQGGDGYLAQRIVVGEQGLVRTPDHLDDDEAATLPCAGLTAWSAVVALGGVRPGDTVLVEGTGGVALFALQFAKLAGARVIVTSSSDTKLERVRQLGADHGINYRTEPEWGQVARRWAGRPVDHIVELGGQETLDQALRTIRIAGTISMIGVLSGPQPRLNMPLVVMRQVRLQGVTVGPRIEMEAMIAAMAQARMRPVIDRRFPFAEAAAAFRLMSEGSHFGKIVITL